jgi:hypothetical protein
MSRGAARRRSVTNIKRGNEFTGFMDEVMKFMGSRSS